MDLSKLSTIQTLIIQSLLKSRLDSQGVQIFDSTLGEEAQEALGLKNVCAKVSPQLSDKIDTVCSDLGISKRRFLESAMLKALEEYESIKSELGEDDFWSDFAANQAEAHK